LGSFIAAASVGAAAAQSQPEGQLTVAFDASIAPTFLDPAETPGIGTPFVFLYAMHDALIKPLPGHDMATCLAESGKETSGGLGPYRVVRQTPAVELVLEANAQYWRKKPSIKTIIIKGVPDRTTRLAMLKTGEAAIGYLMVGVEASTIKGDSKLRLARVIPPA